MATVAVDDPEQMTLVEVLTAWSRAIGTGYSRRLTIAKLLAMINEQDPVRNYNHPELRAALLATAPRGWLDAQGLGSWLRKYKGRIVGNLYLRNRPDVHGADWWVDTPHYPTGPTEPDQVGCPRDREVCEAFEVCFPPFYTIWHILFLRKIYDSAKSHT